VLAVLAFTRAALGHSLISGHQQPVFLAVLAATLAFGILWRALLRWSIADGWRLVR
jgi:hypothetical protein